MHLHEEFTMSINQTRCLVSDALPPAADILLGMNALAKVEMRFGKDHFFEVRLG